MNTIRPSECIAGVWYLCHTPKSTRDFYGKVLACGNANPPELLPAFACRLVDGTTQMRYLDDNMRLSKAEVQSWDDER